MKNFTLLALFFFSIHFNAQTLNANFGNGGIVTGTFSNNPSSNKILQAVPTSTGKLIVLGDSSASYGASTSGFLSRIYPNGAIDYSFSPIGYKSCGFFPSALAIQSNDKIIVSGRTYLNAFTNSPVVNRYNADGTIDNSFSCMVGSFPAQISSANSFFSQSIVVQTDGKILVGGYIKNGLTGSTYDIDIALFRLNTDGSFDTTFNSTGYVIITNPSSKDFLFSLAIQSDGKIVAAGSINSDFSCWRFNSNGTFDTSFGTNGNVTKNFGGTDVARSITIVQSTGEIIVSGVLSSNRIAFVKYSASGSEVYNMPTSYALSMTNLVNTISTSGTTYNIATTNLKYVESTHKILISGTYNNTFSVFQFDDSLNGSFDTQYSFVSPDPNNYSSFLATLSNGTIVTGGSSYNSANYSMNIGQFNSSGSILNNSKLNFVQTDDNFDQVIELNDGGLLAFAKYSKIVKYNANGLKDLSFGINGVFSTGINFYENCVKKQSDGKILYAEAWGQKIYRLNVDGTPDIGFSYDLNNALATSTSLSLNAYIDSFGFASDGKIYIAFEDYHTNVNITTFYLARLNADFSFDTSFDFDGVASFTFPDFLTQFGYGWPTDLIIQNNGKVIVIGMVAAPSSANIKLGLCRFNTNGSLDTSFNSTGFIELPQNPYYNAFKAIKLSDDSFYISERKFVTNHYEYDLIKFNGDGVIDTSFGNNGILNDDLNQLTAVQFVVLPNNKIIKGGTSIVAANSYSNQFKMVCYNSDGTLDTSFGTNGYLTTNVNNFSQIYGLTVLQNGNLLASGYSSTITNNLATMAQYSLNNLSNEEFSNAKNIFIYPNPAKSKIAFDNTNEKFESVSFYNSLGQEVFKTNLNATEDTIDISNLPSGIYIVNFKSSENFKSIKLIKE